MSHPSGEFKHEDDEYQIEKAPKRCNYKKIKLNVLFKRLRLNSK